MIKTSSVLIVAGDIHAVYPSVGDVPEPLRQRLIQSTTGRNSGTIVIADRRGKEEIEKTSRFERAPGLRENSKLSVDWGRMWPALAALAFGLAGACVAFLVHW